MGFLDHTTDNIIIDAVLTERGRELLARNDGSFKIDAFSFGDDEIDYSNIVKYGLTTGKEKIERNTPIFEAQTSENFALKYNNVTLSNQRLRILYIPILQRYQTADTISLTLNSVITNSLRTQNIKVLSTIIDSTASIDANLTDKQFEIKLNSLLLSLFDVNTTGTTTTAIIENNNYIDDDENFVRTYRRPGISASTTLGADDPNPIVNRQLLSFTVGIKNGLTNQTLEKFGTVTKDNSGNITGGSINTFVEIIGMSSGARIVIPVKITINNT
jgi:hypothetical protein